MTLTSLIFVAAFIQCGLSASIAVVDGTSNININRIHHDGIFALNSVQDPPTVPSPTVPPVYNWIPCYRALQTLPVFYELYAGIDGCAPGDLPLSSNFIPSPTQSITLTPQQIADFYTSNTNITHYRCKVVVDGVEYPVCRPDMISDEPRQCDDGDAGELYSPVGGYAGYEACLVELNLQLVCYNQTILTNYVELNTFLKQDNTNLNLQFTPPTTFECSSDIQGCADGTTLLDTDPEYMPDNETCSAYSDTFATTSPAVNWVRCHAPVNSHVKAIICRPSNYNGGACNPDNSETAPSVLNSEDATPTPNSFSNVDHCITETDEVAGTPQEGRTRCCCYSSTRNQRRTCGIPQGTNLGTANAVLTGCKCECVFASFVPIRLGEYFVAYGSSGPERSAREC